MRFNVAHFYHGILFTLFIFIIVCVAEVKGEIRNKRILYGLEAKKKYRDAYSSFRYYVYLAKPPIGEINEDPSSFKGWIRKFFHLKGPAVQSEWMQCGGSLLTPNVVQTACHCLALFSVKSETDNYTYAWPLNVWEDRIYSYVGSNEVSKMYDMLIPKHYIVYQECRIIEFGLNIAMMDFGLIITKDSVNKKAPNAPISYVPAYKAKDIVDFYYEATRKELMCLVIGLGYWKTTEQRIGRGFHTMAVPETSEVQRWGWRNVMNYVDCFSASYPPDLRRKSRTRPFYNYTADSTQVCLKAFTNFKKHYYNLGSGDSGGPVTCNDVYFAVNSMKDELSDNILSFVSPIVYTTYENSAEYRDTFISYINFYFNLPDDNKPTDVPHPHPDYPDFTPTPPPIRPASQSSLKIINYYFLILNLTILNISAITS